MEMKIEISTDGWMNCPACGMDNGTHIDEVRVLNAAGQEARVTATGEDEWARLRTTTGPGFAPYEGRRHTVVLVMRCENCNGAEIAFKQRKGATEIAITRRR